LKVSAFTDLRFVSSVSPTGVNKHITEMVKGLARNPVNEVTLLTTSDQQPGTAKYREMGAKGSRQLPLPWKLSNAIWNLSGKPAMDRYCRDVDWVYCPKNDFIPLKRTKLAVTVHGAHELDPQFPQATGLDARMTRFRSRLTYNRIFRRADVVLTVSDFLKNQIVEWFSYDENRIVVVGNGVGEDYFAAAEFPEEISGSNNDRPYFLCVGGLNFIDGGDRILDVAQLMQQSSPEVKILVAGSQHEAALLQRARNLPNVELLGYVQSAKLAGLLREAYALLYLTRYETFGIAAAEAMAVGTPVITAGGTAVREVVGDSALFVTAEPEDIRASMELVMSDAELRHSLRLAGRARAKKYTWQACVNRLQSALESR
jgi:glycosyltransferase involved in cell wall biosynthesis